MYRWAAALAMIGMYFAFGAGVSSGGPALLETDTSSTHDDKDSTISGKDLITTGAAGAALKLLTRPNTTASPEREQRDIDEDMSTNWRKYRSAE